MEKVKKKDNIILKEIFIQKYCKLKGWNKDELTTSQILEIVNSMV